MTITGLWLLPIQLLAFWPLYHALRCYTTRRRP